MDKNQEIFLVDKETEQVVCNGTSKDGGDNAAVLGHPKVYYTFQQQKAVTCGYCDRLFTKVDQPNAKPYSPPTR